MNDDHHEQIQRCLNGESSAEEFAALQEALQESAALRALYLDYANLDVALGAVAEMSPNRGSNRGVPVTFPSPAASKPVQTWHWPAAAAACAALVFFFALPRGRDTAAVRPDVAAAIASTQRAIDRLSLAPVSSLSISPTASLLAPPAFSPGQTRDAGN